MKNEFVSYEQAVALRELGFDEPCFGYYVVGEIRGINLGYEEFGGVKPYYQRFGFHTITNNDIDNLSKVVVSTPLKQQVFRWFREKYDLTGLIHIGSQKFSYSVNKDGHRITPLKDYLNYNGIYEKAENACIDKLIELAKK